MKPNNYGIYKWEHVRGGKVIASGHVKNTVSIEGRNLMLNVQFRSTAQQASWYFGLIDSNTFSAFDETDTMASHPGWTEYTGYSETTRQQWTPTAASGASLTNATPAVFTANATGNVYGFFISTSSTKGGTAGIYWSGVAFSTGILNLVSGDEVRVTYIYGVTAG